MSLNGVQLKMRDVAVLAYQAGWHDVRLLADAVAICSAESSRYTQAVNPDNPDGSVDYGLWQINSKHFGQTLGGILVEPATCYDPAACATIAHALQKAEGWQPWAAYTSGRYLEQVPGALNGIRYWQLLAHDLPLPT